MKIIKKDLSHLDSFKLVVFGDLHLGDPNCNLNKIKETIKYVKETKDCYVILNGDIMNNAIPGSKSNSIDEEHTMEAQQDLAIELFTPIKDRILVIATGNHENRTYRLTGINPLRYVARSLDAYDRFADNSYLLSIKLSYANSPKKAKNYSIFGIHGAYGGGRHAGAAAKAIQEMSAIVTNADLYIRNHTHSPVNFSDDCLIISPKGNTSKHTRTYYNANAFLNYGGYAEEKGYRVANSDPSVVIVKAFFNSVKDASDTPLGTYFKTYIVKI